MTIPERGMRATKWFAAACAALALTAPGCSDTHAMPPPPARDGVLTFDAAMLSNDAGEISFDAALPGVDGGGPRLPDAGLVSENVDGVLTNVPRLRFYNVGLADLVMVNAMLRMFQRDDGSWTFLWAGELENVSVNTHCIILMDATVGGLDVLAAVSGPRWMWPDSVVGDTREVCAGPGQRLVFVGVENEQSPNFLSSASAVYYAPSSFVRTDAIPDLAEPQLTTSTVVPGTIPDTYTITARFWGRNPPVYNFSANFYPRIGGLLWDLLVLYHPDDLFPFETFEETATGYSHEDYFEDFAHTTRYLVRRHASRIAVDGPTFARRSEAEARMRQVIAARAGQ